MFAGLTVAAIRQPTPYRSGQTLGEMVLALAERKPLAQAQVLRQPEFASGNSIGPPQG